MHPIGSLARAIGVRIQEAGVHSEVAFPLEDGVVDATWRGEVLTDGMLVRREASGG